MPPGAGGVGGISIRGSGGGGGGLPAPAAVTLTAPTNGASVHVGQQVTVTATTSDTDVTMTWLLDGNVIATDAASPYSQTWTVSEAVASYTLVARATRWGQTTDSAAISLNVIAAPDTILGASLLQWVRSDSGLACDGSNRISAWNDRTAAAKHYTQGTAANKSLYTASGGPNDLPYVTNDSTARFLTSSLATPNPSTTPTTVWVVLRQKTWVNLQRILSDADVNKRLLYQRGASPQINLYDGVEVGANGGAVLNSWVRGIAVFDTGANSRLKLAATDTATLTDGDQAAGSGRNIGNSGADGQGSAVCDYCEVLYVQGTLSAPQEAALDAYAVARYGASLLV